MLKQFVAVFFFLHLSFPLMGVHLLRQGFALENFIFKGKELVGIRDCYMCYKPFCTGFIPFWIIFNYLDGQQICERRVYLIRSS